MPWTDPEEQLRILARISEEVIPEDEFLAKAGRSAAEDRPLNCFGPILLCSFNRAKPALAKSTEGN